MTRKNKIKMTSSIKFCFAHPRLPFGTVGEANPHCTHLQITRAGPQTKFAKECNFPDAPQNYMMFLSYYLRYNCIFEGYILQTMNRIKEVLGDKGIKQTWLAVKLGKSYNMVNSYVQNRSQPSLEDLYKIAEILDIDIKDLIISNK